MVDFCLWTRCFPGVFEFVEMSQPPTHSGFDSIISENLLKFLSSTRKDTDPAHLTRGTSGGSGEVFFLPLWFHSSKDIGVDMSLVELWEQDQLSEKRVDQVIGIAGDGSLIDKSSASASSESS